MSSATYSLTRIRRSLNDAIPMETSRPLPDSLKLLRLKPIPVVKELLSDLRPHGTKPAND